MQVFAKIIVERTGDQWTAWFETSPEVTLIADSPTAAMKRLLDYFLNTFDSKAFVSVDEETSDGHLVFLIPFMFY